MSDYIANKLTSTSARGSIHGHIYWNNGKHTDFIYARIVNREERKADFIELDGERYERVRECKNISEPPEGFLCSLCGWGDFAEPSHLLTTAKFTSNEHGPNFCPNCGAKVKVGE